MTLALILTALEDYLRPLVEAEKGMVSVAEMAEDAMEMLSGNAPERWRVVLSTDGEKAAEDSGRGGLMTNEIIAYLQVPKGLEAQPAAGLHRKAASFLNRLAWTVKALRAVEFDSGEIDGQENLNYRGWEWLKYQDVPAWRAARLTFELQYAHDDPTTETRPVIILPAILITGISPDGGFYLLSQAGVAVGRVPRLRPVNGDAAGAPVLGLTETSNDGGFYTVHDHGAEQGFAERHGADEADTGSLTALYRIQGGTDDDGFWIVTGATNNTVNGRIPRF